MNRLQSVLAMKRDEVENLLDPLSAAEVGFTLFY